MRREALAVPIFVWHVLVYVLLLAPTFSVFMPSPTQAIPQVQQRYDKIADPLPSVATTHEFGFRYTDFTSGVGSVSFEFCSNSPIPEVACVPPTGLDVSSATLATQTGETGFGISSPDTTTNRLVITRTPQVPSAPTAASVYRFDNVVNPDTAGSHYVRIQTFNSTDGFGAALEDGGVAFAITSVIAVSTEVPPYLKLCSSVTIIGFDCVSATSFFIDLGEFSLSSSNYASSELVLATNAGLGYSVTLAGTTLTSGNNIIAPIAPAGPSSPGLSQFGLNLRDNSKPNIGANPIGPGIAAPVGDYNVPNQFKFLPGDVIISGSTTTDNRKFTVSYVTNVSSSQPAGVYATTVSFIALANF